MKITADRQLLRAAFSLVGPIVPPRSPSDVMKNAKLIVTPTGTELIALNEAMGIRAPVQGVTVARPGECLLAPDKMTEILAKSPDKVLEIEADGSSVHVRGARAKYRLPTENPALFPHVPGFDVDTYVHIWANEFRSLIRRTVFAVEKFKPNSITAGVLWETEGTAMRMVAISSASMGYAHAEIEGENDPPSYLNLDPKTPAPVIPVATLKFLGAIIPDDANTDVHLSFADKGSALVHIDGLATLSTRCLEGRFPRYDTMISRLAVGGQTMTVEAGELRAAIEQAAVATSEESKGIDFTFSAGLLQLKCQSAHAGDSDVEMSIEYDGPPLGVIIDPTRGLLDGLRAVGDAATITLRVQDPTRPVTITTGDGGLFVVMPMSIQS